MPVQIGRPANRLASRVLSEESSRLPPPAYRTAPEFLEAWNRITACFEPEYFLPADQEMLEQYVDLTVETRNAATQLADEGNVIETPKGVAANPMVGILSGLRREMRNYARMLRVGPSTRSQGSNVKIGQKATKSTGKTFSKADGKITFLPLASQH